MAAAGTERQFAIIVKVDNHIRNTDLSVVYTNDPVVVENSINTLEQLLAEDDKYKVIGSDLEYISGHVRHDQKVIIAQLCMCHHVLIHNVDYRFATVDNTIELKVLNTSGLSCQKLVNIQG
ncbi:hypothetical protein D1007_56573 [Hordeum vulgare]|nr:hypothetical protein D1007_56573 [Hordeum vulgare]